MNFKRFSTSDNQWRDVPYYIHNASTDTITTLPAVLYPNAATATVGLKGQATQSGTPTPDNPIMPQGTGERTGNLCPDTGWRSGQYRDGVWETTNTRSTSDFFPVSSNQYRLKINAGQLISFINFNYFDNQKQWLGNRTTLGMPTFSPTAQNIVIPQLPSNAAYMSITIRFYNDNGNPPIPQSFIDDSNIMVSEGTSEPSYEPYGIEIPISSANTTTPVYLGEVETTRKIKKLVLTGEETITFASEDDNRMVGFFAIPGMGMKYSETGYCNILQWKNSYSQSEYNRIVANGSTRFYMSIAKSALPEPTFEGFIAYLAAQYAAGTPVTVWYVLAEPTTGIVNEPLMKIGDYADTLSNVSIPVTAGGDTLSVGTTVQPSEVTVNYKGWHPVADVHVYPDSSWLPTSWEECRKAVRSGKAQSLYPVGTKLYENWGDTTSDAWIVVDYPTGEDYLDSDLAQQGYTNRVMLMEEKLNYLRQFDAIEAWLYVETAIPAGTYRFTIPNYDASYGGNKTYIFTSTANVPVGGQLTLTWAYQQNPSAVQAYSSATSTSALFNVSITEWDGTTACTDLGTIKLAQNDADSTYGKLNHIHRARYGSNNYYQSGYRQWLNTNASANWWTPTNVFDRPYGNRTNAGRLNVMNSNMKSVLATPTVNCITNNLFEYPSLDGTTFSLQTAYTVTDKLFPVTHSEINLSSSPNVNSVLDYYVGKGNADRIKYRKDNGNAYYWWVRTPRPTNDSNVRYVVTSGALDDSGANSTVGSAAACIIQ